MGPIILQGPHHSAQKSRRTGLSAFRTSCSKDASLTCLTPALMNIPYQFIGLELLSLESVPSPYIINKL
jgi:hypothetical protein